MSHISCINHIYATVATVCLFLCHLGCLCVPPGSEAMFGVPLSREAEIFMCFMTWGTVSDGTSCDCPNRDCQTIFWIARFCLVGVLTVLLLHVESLIVLHAQQLKRMTLSETVSYFLVFLGSSVKLGQLMITWLHWHGTGCQHIGLPMAIELNLHSFAIGLLTQTRPSSPARASFLSSGLSMPISLGSQLSQLSAVPSFQVPKPAPTTPTTPTISSWSISKMQHQKAPRDVQSMLC